MVTSELKMGQRIATTSFADKFFLQGVRGGGEDGRILESPKGVQLKPCTKPEQRRLAPFPELQIPFLTPYTLTSLCMLSILFSIKFLSC